MSENTETNTLQTPPCPHFGPCRGCQLQHLAYSAQLEQKSGSLRGSLEAAGLTIPELQLHASPPLGYRNRIRLTLGRVEDRLRAGYVRLPSVSEEPVEAADPLENVLPSELTPAGMPPQVTQSSFLPIAQCPIAAPVLWNATEAILDQLNQNASTWLEHAPFALDQLELFTTADESRLQLSLFVRTSAKTLPDRFAAEFGSLCEAVRSAVPALTGAGMYLLPPRSARSRRIEQPRPGPSWGSPGLNYTVPTQDPRVEPLKYWVPRGAFFQVNRFLLPDLLSVAASTRSGNLAWDLYAGVGLFTRAVASRFNHITAVEAAEPSFTALTTLKLSNVHAVKATTLEFLNSAVMQRERPDLIVLDPPRTGAGPEVCRVIGRLAASTVVYVSCSPNTLPADLATLGQSGYSISELHLFDLFPQTSHIETVTILRR